MLDTLAPAADPLASAADSAADDALGPLLTNRFGERYLPAVNRETFSRVGAEAVFTGQFGQRLWEEDAFYLIGGTDSGLLLHHILQRPVPPGTRYLFIELPEVLARLTAEGVIPDPLPAGVAISTPGAWIPLAHEWGLQDYIYANGALTLRSLGVEDGHREGYLPLWQEVNNQIGAERNQVTRQNVGRIAFSRALENLGENRHPLIHLKDLFKGETAVLLAGGPSLDEIIPWVRENRERLVVLAVARVAGRLLDAGLVPDMVFSIDPNEVSYHESRRMLELPPERCLFVSMYHVVSPLAAQWVGGHLYMGDRFPWHTPANPDNVTFDGITVANQALGAAFFLGCTRVILGGMDLCFTREGFSHAGGMAERERGPYLYTPEVMVETNGGWQAETRPDFHHAMFSLSYLARAATQVGREVINPAAGAARVEGVRHLPLGEIVLPPRGRSAWEAIAQRLPREGRAERSAHYQACQVEVARFRKRLDKVRALVKEAGDCNERMFGRRGKAPDFQFKKRMDAIEATLDERYGDVAELVKAWGMAAFRGLARKRSDEEWTPEQIEEQGRNYYRVYRESAAALERQLSLAQQRLLARLEEERPKPRLNRLLEQWRKDHHHLRGLLWLDRRQEEGGPPLDDAQRQALEGLVAEHGDYLAVLERRYQEALPHQVTPERLLAKARYWFRHRELQRLVDLAEGIAASNPDPVLAQSIHLMEGYVAELANRPDLARSAYVRVTADPFQEEGLSRLGSLLLQLHDLPAALPVFQELARRSSAYLPPLADLQRMMGEQEAAIATLGRYREGVPDDLPAALKLFHLLQEAGREADALALLSALEREHPESRSLVQLRLELVAASAE